VNVTLDMILGVQDILISWFAIILALIFIIRTLCDSLLYKDLSYSQMQINSLTYLLSYLSYPRWACL